MKYTKTIIALLLSLVMALAPLSVSVYAGGDGIAWTFYDVKDSYHLLGEATLGENVFPESYSAMTFTAKEAGLYLVNVTTTGSIGFYGFSGKYDGNIEASDIKDCVPARSDNNWAGDIYRFEKGETQVFGIDSISFLSKATVSIEYIGKFKSLECTDKDRIYIIDQDIYDYKNDNGVNCVDLMSDLCLITDKTDKYIVNPSEVTGKLYSGKCNLTVNLLGYKAPITVKCVKVTDFIKKAEFPDGFKPVIKAYFDDSYNFSEFCPKTIEVTLKNGTKKTLEADEYGVFCIEPAKGVTIYLGVYTWWNDDGTCDAFIGAGAEQWDRTTCTFEDVSYLENSSHLGQNLLTHQINKFNWISGDLFYGGPIDALKNAPIYIAECYEGTFEDIHSFCNFYMSR